MQASFNLDAIELFVVFVLPGLISMQVYRLVMPARALEWGNAIIHGLFYSSVNFAILSPLIFWAQQGDFVQSHPVLYSVGLIAVLFVFPIIWPLLLGKIYRSKWFKRFQIPYPTAWDYFFDKREEVFALIHLNDGNFIGGYFGGDSYAGDFPNDGDLYLQAVYSLDDDGHFLEPVEMTRGMVIRKDQYDLIEFFVVPPQNEDEEDGEILRQELQPVAENRPWLLRDEQDGRVLPKSKPVNEQAASSA